MGDERRDLHLAMDEEARPCSVSVRAIAIGAALVPLTCMWVVSAEILWYSSQPTTVSLMPHVVFMLFWLTVGNLVVARLFPGAQLDAGELLTIYVMLAIGSVVCGHDSLEILVPMITHWKRGATPESGWAKSFHDVLPRFVLLEDEAIMKPFYLGGSSMYRWDVVRAWARPMGWWASFVFVLVCMHFLINTLLRKQWTENEKLSYPVVQIPLELSRRTRKLFSARLLWIGFAIAASIDLINGLNYLYPAIPQIPIVHIDNLRSYFTERPWNAVGSMWISLYPFAIGVCFFLPLDLAFSCWFFFLFWQAQRVAASSMGVVIPGFPFVREQTAGGYIALAFVAVWVSRKYLKDIFLHIVGGRRGAERQGRAFLVAVVVLHGALAYVAFLLHRLGLPWWTVAQAVALPELALLLCLRRLWRLLSDTGTAVDESGEALPHRLTVLLLVGCLAYLGVFLTWLGASWPFAVLFLAIFVAISVSIARLRAELGPPAHDLHYAGPDQMMPKFFGMKTLGRPTLAALSLTWFFNRAYRGHPIAPSLEGYKLAQQTGTSSRRMLIAMVVALALGIFGGFWSMLHVGYKYGMQASVIGPGNWFGQEPFTRLHGWASNPQPANAGATIGTGVGLTTAILLALMRMRFAWWPFHPVGYAISGSWSMEQLWFPIFVSWLVKWAILRYGGAKAYRKAVPLFVGLVLGEFVVGCLWDLHGIIAGIEPYSYWPY